MLEELAGASGAALDLVVDQQDACLIAQLADELEVFGGRFAHAALALHRLDDHGCEVRRGDFLLERLDIAELDRAEAREARAEAFAILVLRAGIDAAQRPAMEGSSEGQDADALGLAFRPVIAAGDLDAAFDRLGAGVGEEGVVGEGEVDIALREALLPRHAIHVRCVPELVGLVGKRLDQRGVCMPQRIDRDTGDEIEIGSALVVIETHALASLQHDRSRAVDGKDGIGHWRISLTPGL